MSQTTIEDRAENSHHKATCNVHDISLNPGDSLHLALDALSLAAFIMDLEGNIAFMNRAASKLLGISPNRAYHRHWSKTVKLLDDISRQPLGHYSNAVSADILNKKFSAGANALLKLGKGRLMSVEYQFIPLRGIDQKPCATMLTLQDISNTRELVTTLIYQATHDPLTRLVNRREFEQRMTRILRNTSKHKTHALVIMDLDGFKRINDNFGHGAGDEVLRQVAEVLASTVRERDTLARLGGDEFGLLLEHCSARQALKTATHIRQVVRDHYFHWHDNDFCLDISIGIASLARSQLDLNEAMNTADVACYVAKKTAMGPILAEHMLPSQAETHGDDSARLAQHHSENTLTIETGRRFDSRCFDLFSRAFELIKNNPIERIEIEMKETHTITTFGKALMAMMERCAREESAELVLLNINDNIRDEIDGIHASALPQETC